MSDLMICEPMTSAISSPESASGRTHFDAQAGQMIDLFGPVPVLANLSPRQAKELGLMTSGTCGLRGTGSSASAALQSSLESRLRARLSSLGSTLYTLTWKPWTTPTGVSRSRLRASVRRTSEIELSGWPTPTTRDHKDGAECANVPLNALLGRVAWLAGWPTPTAALADKGVRSTEGGIREAMRNHGPDLAAAVCLAGWNTPAASDGNGGKRPHPDTTMTGQHPNGRKVNMGLASQVHLGFLKTEPARLTASGELLTGCSAGMESGGQLNPAHSRWLMGLPVAWDECAPIKNASPRFVHGKTKAAEPDDSEGTATRSTPKRRRNSSSQPTKS